MSALPFWGAATAGPPPTPKLVSLDPGSVPQGTGLTKITVHGIDFVKTAIVNWNGGPIDTTYISDLLLEFSVDLTPYQGVYKVAVQNALGGTLSNFLDFTLIAPVVVPLPDPVPVPVVEPPPTVTEPAPVDVLTTTAVSPIGETGGEDMVVLQLGRIADQLDFIAKYLEIISTK